ncbi:MAG: hypothetical protein U0231_17965 [Nitrospiraceae bacterium]
MGLLLLGLSVLNITFHERAIAQKTDGQAPAEWVDEIEKILSALRIASSAMIDTMKSGRGCASRRQT